jgi:hypothetical protein
MAARPQLLAAFLDHPLPRLWRRRNFALPHDHVLSGSGAAKGPVMRPHKSGFGCSLRNCRAGRTPTAGSALPDSTATCWLGYSSFSTCGRTGISHPETSISLLPMNQDHTPAREMRGQNRSRTGSIGLVGRPEERKPTADRRSRCPGDEDQLATDTFPRRILARPGRRDKMHRQSKTVAPGAGPPDLVLGALGLGPWERSSANRAKN